MDTFFIPTPEDVDRLYRATLNENNTNLNEVQTAKFRHACYKVFIENQNCDFQSHIEAATIYLRLILDFPELTL